MKRILVVTEVFWPENGLVNDFVLELVRRGYRVDVLTQHPSYPYGRVFDGYANTPYALEEWNGVRIHRFRLVEGYRESKIRKIQNYWTFVRQGTKLARRIGDKYDHVVVYQTGPLTVALPAVAIKRRFGTPLTVWTFDIWPDAVYAYGFPRMFPLTAFLNKIIRSVYRAADDILVSSRAFAQVIQRYVPGREIVYAPNWLTDTRNESSGLSLDKSRFHFTFAGNISVSQNLDNVLAGWKEAGLQGADLNIVGDGSALDRLKKQVEEQQIANVRFHGRYPSEQIADILRQSDALVLSLVSDPGVRRTEPFKLQSYLAAGKPIFGAIDGAGREIVEQNGLGLCAAADDPHQIARQFVQMCDFVRNDRGEVARKAAELLRTRFDREETLGKVLACIENGKSGIRSQGR